jgi:hypothetical protein
MIGIRRPPSADRQNPLHDSSRKWGHESTELRTQNTDGTPDGRPVDRKSPDQWQALAEGGRRKAEGGRRKAEGGRLKAEG